MAKDHGPSIKNDEQYEGLRKKGMSKERAARIANSPGSSKRGGESSGSASPGPNQRASAISSGSTRISPLEYSAVNAIMSEPGKGHDWLAK